MKVTELEIVERAIKDAIKGGLSKLDVVAMLPPGHTNADIMVMLYDHRFNKALWGEKTELFDFEDDNEYGFSESVWLKVWKYHIVKMALSGDPLAYIAKNKYGIKVEV